MAEGLTFLEKLVLRALPTRQVPAESGVRFAISSKAKEDGICLIFKVDDPDVPIVEEGPRPDYLTLTYRSLSSRQSGIRTTSFLAPHPS